MTRRQLQDLLDDNQVMDKDLLLLLRAAVFHMLACWDAIDEVEFLLGQDDGPWRGALAARVAEFAADIQSIGELTTDDARRILLGACEDVTDGN